MFYFFKVIIQPEITVVDIRFSIRQNGVLYNSIIFQILQSPNSYVQGRFYQLLTKLFVHRNTTD